MIKYIRNMLTVLLITIALPSCTTDIGNDANCFLLKSIKPGIFQDYILYTFASNDAKTIFVISKIPKYPVKKDTLQRLESENCYNLTLKKLDSNITLVPLIRGPYLTIAIDDIIFWKDDTLKADVYVASEIIGKYIRK